MGEGRSLATNSELILLDKDDSLPDNVRIHLSFGRAGHLNYYFCDKCKIELLSAALNRRFKVVLMKVEE